MKEPEVLISTDFPKNISFGEILVSSNVKLYLEIDRKSSLMNRDVYKTRKQYDIFGFGSSSLHEQTRIRNCCPGLLNTLSSTIEYYSNRVSS